MKKEEERGWREKVVEFLRPTKGKSIWLLVGIGYIALAIFLGVYFEKSLIYYIIGSTIYAFYSIIINIYHTILDDLSLLGDILIFFVPLMFLTTFYLFGCLYNSTQKKWMKLLVLILLLATLITLSLLGEKLYVMDASFRMVTGG